MNNIRLSKYKNSRVSMLCILLQVLVLLSACAATPEVDEAMQTQLQNNIPQDEDLEENATNIELNDELKEELIAQLLADKNLDTSILKSTKKTKCTFELPKGFEESEDMPGMYLNEHYPVDASTIYYKELNKNTALQLVSEETYKENMELQLEQTYGSEVKLKIESFEQTKTNDFTSFKILYTYTADAITFTQLQYIINADKTYVITYSQTDDYDRMAEFITSAETINLE